MLCTTSEAPPGLEVTEILGVVEGSVVLTKHMGRQIAAGLKSIVGGELRDYSEMFEDARKQAKSRMTKAAKRLRADAIIVMRYATSEISPGAAEVLCYGTAVKTSA